MSAFIIRRLLMMLGTAFAAVTGIFFMMHSLPGDPALALLGENATEEALRNLRQQLGLNEPLALQYWSYMSGLATGNLGKSIITGDQLAPIILRNLFFTGLLVLLGTIIAVAIGIPSGMYSAARRNSLWDHGIRVLVLLGISTPRFVMAILLILAFAIGLRWFPLMGGGEMGDPASLVRHTFLPALTFGLAEAVIISRLARSSVLENLGKDYVRTAKAKGLAHLRVMRHHVLRNSLIPVTTTVGLSVGRALGGSAVIETVFTRPGLGSLLVDSVATRDYPLTQSTLVVFALLIVSVNGLVDMLYGALDPRIKLA